ncbi:helix-turn-helix transcriptional regulator [Trichloromonas sp.]|uniref:helix-turn-helix transcriptional regulator n=1 Tax=Trichloromonas sp. TaxID=3069249 RepID=UPI002A3843F9|nr:hypothetical protein [Trichloromonas sp.]
MIQPLPFFTGLADVAKILGPGNSRSTCLRREVTDPTWPKRRKVSDICTGYVTRELLEWAARREAIN